MGTARREPPGGWPTGIETVPMRDAAVEAPAAATPRRRDARVVEAPEEVRVRAWVVQRETGAFEVEGVAMAWTVRQVRVRYIDPHGRQGWAWVWASAVTRA